MKQRYIKMNRILLILLIISVVISLLLFIKILENKKAEDAINFKMKQTEQKLKDFEKKYQELEDKYKKMLDNKSKDKDKIIYLTFDDGPSANTKKVIQILKDKNVKGTFFVINSDDSAMYKYIVDSGNSIALHTYKHDYTMYKSANLFMNDLLSIQEKVKKATGLEIKDFRFAGGSSNSYVSNSVFNEIIAQLKNKGFRYHDWNCSSSDASATTVKVDKIIKSSTKCNFKVINLLMHDSISKSTTVEALPKIIDHYKSKGYRFDAINKDATLIQHRSN